MRHLLREIRRAPARIVASVFALALAIGAIGVFAIPTVSTSSLDAAAERDGIPNIAIDTTDTGGVDVGARLTQLDGVEHVETQVITAAPLWRGGWIDLVGLDVGDQRIDVVRVDDGRLPETAGEIVVTEGTAPIGARFAVARADSSPLQLTVVGIGGTSFWTGSNLAFSTIDTAADVAGLEGANRIVAEATGDEDELRATAEAMRIALADADITATALPLTIENGRHPIQADIEQISSLIGLLGVVAGIVGLVLLGSTTNTLIVERSREVAVMRALGAPPRALRRRLRRTALGIALAAVVIGVPLGIAISNVIARMVLEEFVGLTPGLAVSIPVVLASVAFALVGARLVAARAARRVTNLPLAEALRDRDGAPFGRRISERIAARIGLAGLLDRAALRNGLQRRARSMAIAAQIGAAVAALMIIASMATTINDFNAAELEPIRWSTSTSVIGPGLDIDASLADDDPRSEAAIVVGGEYDGWLIDVDGFQRDTLMIDTTMDAGTWFDQPGEAVVSTGFAERVGIDVGDEIEVMLASGAHRYEVSGLHPNRGRAVFVERSELAADLGAPDMANRILSLDATPAVTVPGLIDVVSYDALTEDDSGRTAILLIFGAIGVVVVSVAGLAVASGLAVGIYERRHEFAALRSVGGRRRHVFRVVGAELLVLAAIGIGIGLVAGYWGGLGIARSFEASNAVEIGFVFANGVIPAVVGVVVLGSLGLAGLMVRRVTRHPAAVTLRSAT